MFIQDAAVIMHMNKKGRMSLRPLDTQKIPKQLFFIPLRVKNDNKLVVIG